jgi:chromosome segregation ATPase
VSLPYMRAGAPVSLAPLAAAVAVAGLLTACGREATDEARAAAARALDELSIVKERVSELEVALQETAAEVDDARGAETRFSKDLDALSARLDRSLEKIKSGLSEVRSSSSEGVSAAIAEVGGVARDLEVLEERFNYHLRQGER